MRILTVGDIHNALKALKEVLAKCEYNNEKDQLIFLGDYVDGWPEASELIQYLIELRDNSKISPIFLRGNHDVWCGKWLDTGAAHMIWLQQGGQATMDSYVKTGLLIEDSHRQFFANLLDYYVDDKNRGFVHGGFNSRLGLGHEHYASDYHWDRDLWNLALLSDGQFHDGDLESIRRFEKHKEIFLGHTSTINWRCKRHYPEAKTIKVGVPIDIPMHRCNVWNIDTGCGYNGRLTIMDVNTKKYWQSTPVQELYPNQRGR